MMSTELSGHGYGTDQPGETRSGADRDVTPVPEHAGRNVGMTRAEAHAQLHRPDRDQGGTASGTTDTIRQAERPASGNETGRAANGNPPPGSTEDRMDGNTAPETGSTEADASAPSHDTSRPETSSRDTGENSIGQDNPGDIGGLRGDEGQDPRIGRQDPDTVEADGSRGRRGTEPPGETEDARPSPAAPGSAAGASRPHGGDTPPLIPPEAASPAGRTVGQDTGAAGSRDQDSADTQRPARTGNDAAQPPTRGEGAAEAKPTDAKPGEGNGGENRDQKEEADGQKPVPDASPGRPNEAETNHSTDQNADEQRWVAMEQRMQAAMEQRLNTAVDGIKADYEAKLDSLKAESDSARAAYEGDTAQLKAEISELKTELETLRADRQQPGADRVDEGDRHARPDAPDDEVPGGRRDVLGLGDGAENDAAWADIGATERRARGDTVQQERVASARTGRHVFTSENVTAAGAGLALGQSVAQIFGSVPAEVGVGVAGVALAGAVMETKIRDVVHKIMRKG
jgi:hypothetical protein